MIENDNIQYHILIQWLASKGLLDEWLTRTIHWDPHRNVFKDKTLRNVIYTFSIPYDDDRWRAIVKSWRHFVSENEPLIFKSIRDKNYEIKVKTSLSAAFISSF